MINLVFAHLIGDYILQNDWMAQNKKKSSWACLTHVLFYSLPFIFFGIPLWIVGLIALQHFLQDRTNFVIWFMNAKGSALFSEPPMAPWSIIVTDNILHLLFLGICNYWLL